MSHRPVQILRQASDDAVLEMAHRAPHPSLRRHVRSLIGFDETAPAGRSQRHFPLPGLVLIVTLDTPIRVAIGEDGAAAIRHDGGFVAGVTDRPSKTKHDGHLRGIQIDLAPTAARQIFRLPLSELSRRSVDVQDLLGPRDRHLAERLAEAASWDTRLDHVERVLLERLEAMRVETARVDWAIRQIEAAGGRVRIAGLARELGCSRKHLNALFHDQVGATPKLWARLVRFDRLMQRANEGSSWADLAHEHGYADQSHMAREVKDLMGLHRPGCAPRSPQIAPGNIRPRRRDAHGPCSAPWPTNTISRRPSFISMTTAAPSRFP